MPPAILAFYNIYISIPPDTVYPPPPCIVCILKYIPSLS